MDENIMESDVVSNRMLDAINKGENFDKDVFLVVDFPIIKECIDSFCTFMKEKSSQFNSSEISLTLLDCVDPICKTSTHSFIRKIRILMNIIEPERSLSLYKLVSLNGKKLHPKKSEVDDFLDRMNFQNPNKKNYFKSAINMALMNHYERS